MSKGLSIHTAGKKDVESLKSYGNRTVCVPWKMVKNRGEGSIRKRIQCLFQRPGTLTFDLLCAYTQTHTLINNPFNP